MKKNRISLLLTLFIAASFASGCGPESPAVGVTVSAGVMFGKSGNVAVSTTAHTIDTSKLSPGLDSSSIPTQPNSLSDPNTVSRPNDSIGSSGCNGRGICNLAAGVSPGFTNVTINFKKVEPMALSFGFLLSELAGNQESQAQFFSPPNETYQFEESYPLTNPVFAALNLPPNSVIKPTDVSKFKNVDGKIILTIIFSHDPYPPPPATVATTTPN